MRRLRSRYWMWRANRVKSVSKSRYLWFVSKAYGFPAVMHELAHMKMEDLMGVPRRDTTAWNIDQDIEINKYFQEG